MIEQIDSIIKIMTSQNMYSCVLRGAAEDLCDVDLTRATPVCAVGAPRRLVALESKDLC